MIFQPESIAEILAGHKRMTRRLVKIGDSCREDSLGEIDLVVRCGRALWERGRTYAVCPGRGKPGVARIRLVAIQQSRLQDISDMDLLLEGIDFTYVGTDQKQVRRNTFIYLWDKLNDRSRTRWVDNPHVWVLTFELAKIVCSIPGGAA